MTKNLFKTSLLAALIFCGLSTFAQSKSIQFKKNGAVVREFVLTDIDEVTFDDGINLYVGSNVFENVARLSFTATQMNIEAATSGNVSLNTTEKMTLANNTTGIDDITTDNANIIGYFDILGRKLSQEPDKGLFIIVFDNGLTKKIIK